NVTQPTKVRRWRWEHTALLGILAGAAVLYGWSLNARVLQPYYASAVHSMSRRGWAFLFGGYDPAGVLSVDKPPMAFWVQTLGVWVFGYHWWAIALVQLIEGLAAVYVLNRVVRRWAGERTALLAALLLAISPVTTAINRDNVPDALLVLLVLLAAYCVTRAVEHGRTGWLLAAGAFVGAAFLTKMLAGWLVLPALALAYLAAPVSWPRRIGQLLGAGAVVAVVSLWWPVLVSSWPAGSRPFIGSTTNNSIWQLIFTYNGFGRVAGSTAGGLANFGGSFGSVLAGSPGPLRLFSSEMAGQIAWLLPLAVCSLLFAVVAGLRRWVGGRSQLAGWVLWGVWLATCVGVFSFTGGIMHSYYTAELAPAVAALAAAGLAGCWRAYRAGGRFGLLLPAAVAGSAAIAYAVLDQASWLPWLRLAIVVAAVVSVLGLLLAFPGWRGRSVRPAGVILVPTAIVALVALIAGPMAFDVDTVSTHPDVLEAGDPSGGPSTSSVLAAVKSALDAPGGGASIALLYVTFMEDAYQLSPGQRQVLDYAERAQEPDAPITLAVEGGTYGADPYVLNTDASVVDFGGYMGFDPSPSIAQLAAWTADGRLRFVVLPKVFIDIGNAASSGRGSDKSSSEVQSSVVDSLTQRIGWVSEHCRPVPPRAIGPDAAQAGVLFDCAKR
ncbi:MAG TPA: glycosyltransferase family 39 protein, partial [Pseudonocardiaceae bacterium]|nr:glycosyltransferase family 39 protein [Pseudonocardiaceae bacterium]